MSPVNPCKDCTKREVGCHATCKEHKAWKDFYNKARDTRTKHHDLEDFITSTHKHNRGRRR
jgi:hypothetical protein